MAVWTLAYEPSAEASSAGAGVAGRRRNGVRTPATSSAERSARKTPGDSMGSTKPKASPTISHPGPWPRCEMSW